MNDPLRRILAAWTDEGRCPKAHRAAQWNLREKWPVLANALDVAARLDRTNKRPPLRRVVLESPYAGEVEANEEYARAALRDSLLRGEAPIASHLLYTQPGVLDDNITADRTLGMLAGAVWAELAEAAVVYTDRGISSGMQYGIRHARRHGLPIELRTLRGTS